MALFHPRTWSQLQLYRLKELRANGSSWDEIAAECGHSKSACQHKAKSIGAYFLCTPPEPLSPTEVADEERQIQIAGSCCDSLLAALQEHHPARAGEIVSTDKGIRVIGGTKDKPRFIKAEIRTELPESGNMCRPVPVHPTSSASCAQAW